MGGMKLCQSLNILYMLIGISQTWYSMAENMVYGLVINSTSYADIYRFSSLLTSQPRFTVRNLTVNNANTGEYLDKPVKHNLLTNLSYTRGKKIVAFIV